MKMFRPEIYSSYTSKQTLKHNYVTKMGVKWAPKMEKEVIVQRCQWSRDECASITSEPIIVLTDAKKIRLETKDVQIMEK